MPPQVKSKAANVSLDADIEILKCFEGKNQVGTEFQRIT